MILSRRASSRTVVVSMLLLLLSFGAISLLFGNIFDAVKSENKKAACKESIFLSSLSKSLNPTGDNLFYKVDCEPTELLLTADGKDGIVDRKAGKIDMDKAHKLIADRMAQCWDMVGAGKYDPFSPFDFGDRPICIICDYITVDADLAPYLEQLPKKGISSPNTYLMTHTNPYDNKQTYWTYLYNQDVNTDLLSQAQKDTQVIEDGAYIIIQMIKMTDKSFWSSAWYNIKGANIIGFGYRLVTGAPQFRTPFSDCDDCNARGNVLLIPPDTSLSTPQEVMINGNTEMYPLCSITVNALPAPLRTR